MARAAVACILLVAGCARSPSTADSTLPVIPEPSTPAPTSADCRVSIDGPQGVRVLELIEDSGAAVLSEGDIITGLGTRAIPDLDSLLAELDSLVAGATISIRFLRGSAETTAEITTAADSEGRARLGILGRTHYISVSPQETPSSPAGELTRVVNLEGRLYTFDPAGPSWAALGVRSPDVFVPLGDEVYALSAGEPYLVGLLGDNGVSLETETWQADTVIASVADLVVVGAHRSRGGSLEFAFLGIDPTAGVATWVFPIPAEGAPSIPTLGYTSPDRSRVLVAMAASDFTDHRWFVLDQSGTPSGLSQPVAGLPYGWFDNDRVLLVNEDQTQAFLFDLVSGETTIVAPTDTLDLEATQLYGAAGDGRHLFFRVGDEVLLAPAFEETEWRPLTIGCQEVVLGDIGWGPRA